MKFKTLTLSITSEAIETMLFLYTVLPSIHLVDLLLRTVLALFRGEGSILILYVPGRPTSI